MPFGVPEIRITEAFRPESSTAFQTVTSRLTTRFKNQNAALMRIVSLLLVAFIFYGTTVEAAHCHRQVRTTTSQTSSLIDPSLAKNLTSGASSCTDCLICQLQQNFSTTCLSLRPHVDEAGIHILVRGSDPIGIRAQANTPQTGRAPPQAN